MKESVILVPTYNERENIQTIVPEIFATAPECSVVVIDDNSPDNTAGAVRDMMLRYPALSLHFREKKEGLGAAYKDAIAKVLQERNVARIITMDADGSHDPKYLRAMLDASQMHDFVLGSRYVGGGRVENWEAWRMVLSRCGNLYARVLTGLPLHDMTAGFVCMRGDLLKRMQFDRISASGYAFLIDLKFQAIKEAGADPVEIPIHLRARREGESKISSHIIGEGLRTPLRLFLRRFRGQGGVDMRKSSNMPSACHICSSSDIAYFCKKRGYDLYRCRACGLTFLYPMPTDLTKIYTEEYFKNVDQKDSHGYTDYDKDKEPMRGAFVRAIEKIERLVPGRTIFDVGAATGYFLDVARTRNWKTKGSEVSEYGAQEAARRGHEMIYGDLTTKETLPVVDAVTLWDVLEHVADPRSLVTAINHMLPVGGVFVLNTPDIGGVWPRLLGSAWQLLVPPEHVHYYNTKNIRLLLEQCGFEVLEVSRMGKHFTIPYIFKMLWSWQRLAIWDTLVRWTDASFLRSVSIPINLRDNMFVLARKVHDR